MRGDGTYINIILEYDLNIECINDTAHRHFWYTAHVPAGLLPRYGAIRLYRVVLITTISHDVRELQRSLQFRSVDNHRPVDWHFFDSWSKSFSPANRSVTILFTLLNCLLTQMHAYAQSIRILRCHDSKFYGFKKDGLKISRVSISKFESLSWPGILATRVSYPRIFKIRLKSWQSLKYAISKISNTSKDFSGYIKI